MAKLLRYGKIELGNHFENGRPQVMQTKLYPTTVKREIIII